jgi:hypothetical protein
MRVKPKSAGFAVATLVSLSLHVAAIAALVYFNEVDTGALPPTAIAIEIVSMSPHPGGEANAGSPNSGSVASSKTPSAEALQAAEGAESKAPADKDEAAE